MITDQPAEPISEKPAAKGEKVRGMNASLTPNATGGGLKERDPGRLNITRRHMAFALILAALGVIAAIFTVNSISSGSRTYPALVTTSKVYDLTFANTGNVTELAVKVGERVTAGQILAHQDSTTLRRELASAEGVVKADQAALTQAQAPQLTPAQLEQDNLQVEQAQTALTNAQASLSSSESSGKAAVAGANSAVGAAQSLVTSDQTRYNQSCPNGPVTPAAGLTGTALQAAQTQLTECQNLQLQLDRDLAAFTQTQAQVPVVQSQSQANINQAQSTVNSAQAALNLANYQVTLQSSPTSPATASLAQANLNQAQSQMALAQQALQQATLVAPDSGTVAEVYGAVGEYVGPDGVHQYQAPAALPSGGSSGIQLFPSATTPSGGSSTTSGFEPLIEIVGGAQQVMAQVPQSNVSGLPVGRTAHVYIPALHLTVPGVVSAVVLNPTRANTDVSYDVIMTLDHTVGGLLPGMSATVRP